MALGSLVSGLRLSRTVVAWGDSFHLILRWGGGGGGGVRADAAARRCCRRAASGTGLLNCDRQGSTTIFTKF